MVRDDDLGSAATQVGSTQGTSPNVTDASPAPSVLAERYTVLGLVGVGGMGRVYRVHDRTLDEVVALKLLKRELVALGGLERFRTEVKLARRVTSIHVVRTFDLGQHGDEHFLTMELVDGHSLAQLLDERELPLEEVMRIARAACAGMAAAHVADVLHRDLKPDNILVATSGRIAITDFGIARAIAAPMETAEQLVGTPAYMAPEQVDGRSPITPATDVYAFGAILYEMLTRRRPFVGAGSIEVAAARLAQAPPDPRVHREMPDELAKLVLRCLARDPAARYADGTALARALAVMDLVATSRPQLVPQIPMATARSIAVLPLRATGELVDVADGLSEEIVDALSMTRSLRVRPLVSVRAVLHGEVDPRAIGQRLGVDVVVDGSLRRAGDQVRISARAIGVADGFQLWASRIDAKADGILAAGDDVARAVARALTVEIAMPQRAAGDPRATALYLEAKARTRAGWRSGQLDEAIAALDRAHAIAPDDANVNAGLALAHARAGFFGFPDRLARARTYADRAVELAPNSGESWLALALAQLYTNRYPEALRASIEAVVRTPGIALAQATLGALLLEVGAIDEGIAHLEGAQRVDPEGPHAVYDLARAYAYAGRHADAARLLETVRGTPFGEITLGRLAMWRGERYDALANVANLPLDFPAYARTLFDFYREPTIEGLTGDMLRQTLVLPPGRLLASRAQFAVEFFAYAGDVGGAFDLLAIAVDSGLHDRTWFDRCPVLAPLRADARFHPFAQTVAQRAERVLAVLEEMTADFLGRGTHPS